MENERLARYWMIIAGIALVGAGLIGFIPDNPIASESADAIFRVDAAHNFVHLVTGAVALAIGLGAPGPTLANATIGFGVLYAIIAVLLIADPTMFGVMSNAPANAGDHVLHVVLAVVSIALGWMARQRSDVRARDAYVAR